MDQQANTAPDKAVPDTVVLIHGLWLTGRSWEKWADRFEGRGYKVLAPNWPGMEGEVEALNADPSPIAELDIDQIVDHYTRIIGELDKPPIIMGHSLGGTVLQVLLDRGLGAAGVGVAAGTVKGVPDLPLSTLRATLPALRNPFKRHSAVPLNRNEFHYAFANTLSQEESDEIYERYHVPCAVTVLREAAFASLHCDAPTTVDFANDDRAPLLFITFEHDHIIPPNVGRHNAEKYSGSKAVTEFQEYLARPHFPGAPGWEEVADHAIEWAAKHAAARARA
ncbi:alpha/beta fold hydrolase [Rubrobacter tropicus]|uniref:Alpha/beta fold hydrolase n=1 Tax=Rubrobacter tropicus TaxID=2653851 RepID=A0A6G8QF80_9ACTN|nr:alpha/beta fold hydrolase [Rubrobacter tropicus]